MPVQVLTTQHDVGTVVERSHNDDGMVRKKRPRSVMEITHEYRPESHSKHSELPGNDDG